MRIRSAGRGLSHRRTEVEVTYLQRDGSHIVCAWQKQTRDKSVTEINVCTGYYCKVTRQDSEKLISEHAGV